MLTSLALARRSPPCWPKISQGPPREGELSPRRASPRRRFPAVQRCRFALGRHL